MPARSRVLVAIAFALGTLPATAAVFTVGAGGTHPSVTAAATAANLSPGNDEIRIASEVRVENVLLGALAAETLAISGGWDATYTTRSPDPSLTILDGAATAHVLYGTMTGGRLEISNLTLRNGQALTGGGIELDLSGNAQLLLADLVLHDNLATWEFASNGGGLKVNTREVASAEIRDSLFRDNRSVSTGNSTLGGGAYFNASEAGHVLVLRCIFENNQAQAPSDPRGGGVYVDAFGLSSIEFRRNEWRGNRLLGGTDSGGGGSALYGVAVGGSELTLRSNIIADNHDESRSDGGQQLSFLSANTATVDLGDSEISDGTGAGASLIAYDTSRIDLTNLTIAGNPGGGLTLNRTATAVTSLYNSILHGNGGTELASNVAPITGSNLIEGAPGSTNPLFADAANGDYRLRAGSPAIDAGNGAPPAGTGSEDADGGTRVVGSAIDLGAFELGSLRVFANGFEG